MHLFLRLRERANFAESRSVVFYRLHTFGLIDFQVFYCRFRTYEVIHGLSYLFNSDTVQRLNSKFGSVIQSPRALMLTPLLRLTSVYIPSIYFLPVYLLQAVLLIEP
jgi:hypothetical protein